ncbi:MAG: FKBP-type peptidyl-prolyl cis-trans isomerase [Lysobacteraceae bacterium]
MTSRTPALPGALLALATAATAAPVLAAGPAAPAPLTTDKDKVSYAIGLDIGKSLKPIHDEVDPVVLKRAIDDVLAGRTPQLDEAAAGAAMQAFGQKMQAKQAADRKVELDRNLAAGKAFLAENGSKPGVVTTPSGLQYQVLTPGTGPKPSAGATVRVHYRGTLLDGTVFDSSYDRKEPAEFALGAVIPGWTEALQLMPVGSKYKLWIPQELAYGEQGTPGGPIPPGSALVFEVELLALP